MHYCHGAACNSDAQFSGAGLVKHGYAKRDEGGYVSVYNFRALGSLVNSELMEIRQEILQSGKTPHPGSSRVVVTALDRNLGGFVTAITQGGTTNGSAQVRREYKPFKVGIYSTSMLGEEMHPEFGSRGVLTRDSAGNVLLQSDFDGSRYVRLYNDQGNLELIRQASRYTGSGQLDAVGDVSYSYDKSGLLTNLSQGAVSWTYEYNAAGLLDFETIDVDGTDFSLYYGYDEAGAITELTYPSGRVVSTDRDGVGRVTRVAGYADKVTYHPNGLIQSYELSNGTSYSLKLTAQQEPWKLEVSGLRSPLVRQTMVYDSRSNVIKVHGHFSPFGSDLDNLTYDGLSRILTASGRWGLAEYRYDDVSNLTRSIVGGTTRDYVVDGNNRLSHTDTTMIGLEAVRYDANKNIVRHGDDTQRFDGLNRLVFSQRDGFNQTNVYDGSGKRVKTVVNTTGSGGGRRATTYFVYARSGELLYEFDKESGEERDHIRLAGKTIAIVGKHQGMDSDNDGMPDYFERLHGLNAFDGSDADRDLDRDGLSNVLEYLAGANPTRNDSDNDGVYDFADPDVFVPPHVRGVVLDPVFDFALSD